MSATQTVTVNDIMRAKGVARTAIWQHIRQGRLPATLDTTVYPHTWRIPVEAAAAWQPATRRWTGAEEEQLTALLGRIPLPAIARRLGRTETAVHNRMKRLGVNQRVGDGHYTANQAAHELGTDANTVAFWIRKGWLGAGKHRPVWGPRRCYIISQLAIEAFIRGRILRPQPRHRWDWRQMPAGYFRNFAAALAKGESL